MRRAFHLAPLPSPAALRWIWAAGLTVAAHAIVLTPEVRMLQALAHPAAPALRTRVLPSAVAPDATTAPATPVAPKPAPTRQPRQPMPAPTEAASKAPPAPIEPSSHAAIAPPAECLYQLRQNGQQGQARLSWQPQGDGYRLLLTRELGGRPLPGWRSQGRLDAQGLEPERYATQRGGRDAQATNFRRDEGLISFSASTELVELPVGVQDHISWWLQLAALAGAAPQRLMPGSEIRLPVVGLRGEPQAWVFELIDEDPVALPTTTVSPTLHLRRAAMGLYDGAIDVWLDPQRGHLPVKLQVGDPEARGWELSWIGDEQPGPPR